jgi:DNA-binding CsgD family transcriptional regulator
MSEQPKSQSGKPTAASSDATHRAALRLKDVRAIFRLVGEIRELGADPNKWRPHMITRLGKMMKAEIMVSSEIHFRATRMPGIYRVHDIGWGCDQDGNTWQINTEREEKPEAYWLSVLGKSKDEKKLDSATAATTEDAPLVPVAPAKRVYGGTSFILSQYPLPHLGAVDQLGVHRAWGEQPFTHSEHRLVRLFHVELGRLWKRDAIKKAQDPSENLPPRLAQTLAELASGSSEKQVSMKLGISRHTVHNYVKALHRRLGVSSRGELLAKAGQMKEASGFTPKLSEPRP